MPNQRRNPIPHFVIALLAAAIVMLMASCGSPGVIQSDMVREVETAVVIRHDIYVNLDQALTPEDRAAALLESGELHSILSQNDEVKSKDIQAKVNSVTVRHDSYVAVDPNLTELERRTYLRSGELLRRLVQVSVEKDAEVGGGGD